MNAGAWLIYSLCFSDHTSDALVSLHWLCLPEKVMFKVDVLTFKSIHGSAPTQLSRLVRIADLPRRTFHSSDGSIHQTVYCRRAGHSLLLAHLSGTIFRTLWFQLLLCLRSSSDWKPICSLSPSLHYTGPIDLTSSTMALKVIYITWTTLKIVDWLTDWFMLEVSGRSMLHITNSRTVLLLIPCEQKYSS